MTFPEAIAAVGAGSRVRHPGMCEGWTIRKVTAEGMMLFLNPWTGSEVAFPVDAAERARVDWVVVP